MFDQVKAGIAAAALLGAALVGFGAGHWIAENAGEHKLAKAEKAFDDERTIWQNDRTAWANERADINSKSLKAIQDAKADSERKEADLRLTFANNEKKYRQRIKELENAQTTANTLIDNPGPDGGLWASAYGPSCTASSGSGNAANVPSAPGPTSGFAGTVRCRLTTETSKALVQIMAEADKKTELLNKCIGTLTGQVNTLNPLTKE